MKMVASDQYDDLVRDAEEQSVRKAGNQCTSRVPMDYRVASGSPHDIVDGRANCTKELFSKTTPLALIPLIRASEVGDGCRSKDELGHRVLDRICSTA